MSTPYQFPTPYINPAILTSAATGISWSTIPNRQATPAQQLAEQYNICARATGMTDTAANQVLRATITTEQLKGPGNPRMEITAGGNTTILLSRSPILSVTGGQVAPDTFPLQWTSIPADWFMVNSPPLSIYGSTVPGDAGEWGQLVTLGAGYIGGNGRGGQFLQITYANGWPHCSLTAAAAAGATVLDVDDCTGWAPPAGMTTGAAGIIYDPSPNGGQETAVVTSTTATAGPGTLTITPALTWTHQQGILFSAMPSQLHWATILFGVSQALIRGATATSVQTISPSGAKTTDGPEGLHAHACKLVAPFRRVR